MPVPVISPEKLTLSDKHHAESHMRFLEEIEAFAETKIMMGSVDEEALYLRNQQLQAPECTLSVSVRNIFFLLSVSGNRYIAQNSIGPSQWADSRLWYLCSMDKTGLPFDLAGDKLYKAYGEMVKRKGSCSALTSRKQNQLKVDEYRRRCMSYEWKEFGQIRFFLLQMLGRNAFRSISIQRSGKFPLNNHRGLLWHNQSCALDSVIFLFPHILCDVGKKELHGRSATGENKTMHVPGSCIVQVLKDYKFETSTASDGRMDTNTGWELCVIARIEAAKVSNYMRSLFIDLYVEYTAEAPDPNISEINDILMWSAFRRSTQLDLNCLLRYALPVLLNATGKTRRTSDMQYRFFTPAPVNVMGHLNSSATVGQLFHKYSKDRGIGAGLYIFQFPLGKTKLLQKQLVRLLKGGYAEEIEGKKYEVCGIIGYKMPMALNHFIAGRPYDRNGKTCIYVYDGMERDGMPRGIAAEKCFRVNGGKFSVFGLSIVMTVEL